MSIEPMTREEVARAFIAKYGIEAQLRKAVEELTELSLAVQHYAKYKERPDSGLKLQDSVAGVIDETTDVELICLQLRLIFGGDAIDERAAFKLNRAVSEYGLEAHRSR